MVTINQLSMNFNVCVLAHNDDIHGDKMSTLKASKMPF